MAFFAPREFHPSFFSELLSLVATVLSRSTCDWAGVPLWVSTVIAVLRTTQYLQYSFIARFSKGHGVLTTRLVLNWCFQLPEYSIFKVQRGSKKIPLTCKERERAKVRVKTQKNWKKLKFVKIAQIKKNHWTSCWSNGSVARCSSYIASYIVFSFEKDRIWNDEKWRR